MNNAEMKNGPHFEMWAIGIAAGLVAGAVMYIVGEYGFMASAFVAALIALVVGAVFGMPKARVAQPDVEVDEEDLNAIMPKAAPAAAVAAAAPVMAAPVAAAEAAPAAFVTMPVEAKPAQAAKPAAAKPAKAPAATKPAAAPKAPKAKKEDGPERLKGPRKGKADDLKEIEGIGPAMEKLVNELGFYHFDQISSWSDADVAWVDANMK
ncbi:MAG: hypothetical protein ACRC6I_05750, partial [Paracoccaceae bacterium]